MNKSITQDNLNDNKISKSIRKFFTRFHLSSALKAANAYKKKGTLAMLELLRTAKKADIPAKYVLFDSWFSSPSSLHSVKEIGYDVIAMVKKTPKRTNKRLCLSESSAHTPEASTISEISSTPK